MSRHTTTTTRDLPDGTTIVVEITDRATHITRWHSCGQCEAGSSTTYHDRLTQ